MGGLKYDVILLRSQDIISDSRVLRWEKWFLSRKITYRIVGWDRKNEGIQKCNTIFWRKNAGFQQRSKGIRMRLKWDAFLLYYLLKHRTEYKCIHACDFDTVLPALFMRLLGKKVIFDIFDWFSDEVKTNKFIIDRTINFLEKLSVKCSNLVIICEHERLRQMEVTPAAYIVIPNIPNMPNSFKGGANPNSVNSECNKIKIAYVGGIVDHRGLRELVDVVSEMTTIQLDIAGFGERCLEKYIQEKADRCANIRFYGKVNYDRAMEIMKGADVLYAMYYKTNANHIFAAPNKFYESLFLQKPIITTEGTLVGAMVKRYHSGFVIDEGIKALKACIDSLSTPKLRQIKIREDMWEEIQRQVKKAYYTYYLYIRS